ncbi:hypothetical protein K488DRAFT_39722 [Vararia minispora EC-137]|uniref:Uncharacterized protein n=1 Tax=Vararia minispora EC-137 TaxID=1314806 RepID=A0ACB8QYY1_9AGAM|nr:hypothetical protein K488DRAFT_39722 [Vararia minispora EC-137]
MAHHIGEPYSEKSPVPKVAEGLRALVSPQKATEVKAQRIQQETEVVEGNKFRDDSRNDLDGHDRTEDMKEGRRVLMRDPTTGSDVYARNAEDEAHEGENVLKLPLPEPGAPTDWDEHRDQVLAVAIRALRTFAIIYGTSILCAIILPLPRWILYPALVLPPLIVTPTLLNKVRNTAVNDADARVWYSERIRGIRAGYSADQDGDVKTEDRMRAEWVNALVAGVWPILNPSLFDSLVDMLEDIMQSSMPKFVQSVRISDLGLGNTPLRIVSVRALPDSSNEQTLEKLDVQDREQLTGDHINLEISFAYHAALSGRSASSKVQNIHLLIDFFSGIQEFWEFKLPVWVGVQGIFGTARVCIQLISDPPFIKTTLFTFLGLPHIKPSVVAMSRAMPNIMNLPLISGFVSSALDTATAKYVAPKCLILDVQRLLGGSDVAKDTRTLGVLVVHIHSAISLKGMDNNGKSDAYVTLTFSRLGKPLFSTRIVKEDLNPIFEETAVLPIDLNVLKLDEKLSIQLWDSDRSSTDDMMGIVELDILEFVRNKNEAHCRIAHLQSPDTRKRPSSIKITLGYYAKLPPNPEARKDKNHKIGRDPGLTEDLNIDDPEVASEDSSSIGDVEKAVLRCPPDDEWVSGILSVQVHEIRDLGIGRGGRAMGIVQEGAKGSDAQGEDEEAEYLPSSYCTISLNDELIYKTRVKPITSSPIFNAGTERFVKDWRTAHIGIKAMDSRMHENDAVIGIIFLRLSDLLVNASQLTRTFHLEHGLGYGRIRISVLFRPVAAKLPPSLRGFDTCMLRIRAALAKDVNVDGLDKCELRIKVTTSASEDKISRKPHKEGGALVWEDDITELPVRQRYAAALVLAFKHGMVRRGKSAMSVLWLRDIGDGTRGVLSLPLWTESENGFARLKQNYAPMNGDLSHWDSDKEKLTRVGTLEVDLEVTPGVSTRHRKRMGADTSKWQLAEEIERMERADGRKNIGQSPAHDSRMDDESQVSGKTTFHSQPNSGWSPTKKMVGSTEAMAGHSQRQSTVSSQFGSNRTSPAGGDGWVRADHDFAYEDGEAGGEEEGEEGEGEGGAKNPIKKIRVWKQNQRELAKEHRGVMQAKPVRTAVWVKDKVEHGVHSVKDRFAMEARQPDVETEA